MFCLLAFWNLVILDIQNMLGHTVVYKNLSRRWSQRVRNSHSWLIGRLRLPWARARISAFSVCYAGAVLHSASKSPKMSHITTYLTKQTTFLDFKYIWNETFWMDFQTLWSISRALGSAEGSSMSTGGTISSQEEVKCHQELRVDSKWVVVAEEGDDETFIS